jgi:hypothetical protein
MHFIILKKEVARGGEQTRVLSISFIFLFSTTLPLSHSGSPKQCILSQMSTTALLLFTSKPYTPAGFKPGSSVPEEYALSTVPRNHRATRPCIVTLPTLCL